MSTADLIGSVGVTTGVLSLLGGFYRWGLPVVRERADQRRARYARDTAIQDVLLGRPAGEPNPVTGEPGVPELPSLGDRLVYVTELAHDLQSTQMKQTNALKEIASEVKNTTRISAVEEIVQEHTLQIRTLHKQVEQIMSGNYERRNADEQRSEPT